MKTNSIRNSVLIVGIAIFLYSCSTTNQYQRNSSFADGLYGSALTSELNLSNENWQNLFNDPLLDSLIAE